MFPDLKCRPFIEDLILLASGVSVYSEVEQTRYDTMRVVLCVRILAMAMCMTAADLCSMYKQWDVQLKLVDVIMEEFWLQVGRLKLGK